MITIGGCYDKDNNQCLKLEGELAACEKGGEVTISSKKLDYKVGIDTWLGRITLGDTIPAFDLKVGSKATTVYVQDLPEGTLWIKAEPTLSTATVKLS